MLEARDYSVVKVRSAGQALDVGRSVGADAIVLDARLPHKPAPRSPAERTIMQMHPVWGAALLADVELPWDIQPIIRWHHERLDGSGYPDALKGDEIPLGAQIVGILNTYDAMITSRPHRAGLTVSEAIAEITRCRHWWSDRVFEAFRRTVQDGGP